MRQELQQEMYGLVEKYEKSGLTMKEFCRIQGVKLHKLQYWRNKYSNGTSPLSGFAKLEVHHSIKANSPIVIKLPNGTIIEIPT